MSLHAKGPAITDSTENGTRGSDLRSAGTHPVPAVVPAVVNAPAAAPHARTRPARRVLYWGSGGVLAAAVGLALYFQPWAAGPASVAFETVVAAPATRVLAVNGRIAASQSVDISPQVSGILTGVAVSEGAVVDVGAALARIDPSAQQAAVRQALAGLDAALVAQDDAQATYARDQALGGNIARTLLEGAARAVQSSAQEVARMTALLDAAQIRLRDFTLTAPMAGTILTVNVDPGQSVGPSTVLMTLADLSQLEVKTDVDEAYATQIRLDQRAVLQLAGEATLRDGRVSAVSQRVDAATGGLAVTLAFDAPVTAPTGLTVTANIIVDSRPAAITLPRTAILTDTQGAFVFLVVEGTARQRRIGMIDWPAARLIVTSGLETGDVVIADATGITDGQAVSEAAP